MRKLPFVDKIALAQSNIRVLRNYNKNLYGVTAWQKRVYLVIIVIILTTIISSSTMEHKMSHLISNFF